MVSVWRGRSRSIWRRTQIALLSLQRILPVSRHASLSARTTESRRSSLTRVLVSCYFTVSELTALAQTHSNVTNLHVSAHVDKHSISMQYTVLPGVSTRSFGVHVASVAHFPKIVVDMAREKAMELEAFGGGEQTSMAVPASAAPSSSQDDQTRGSVSGMKRVSSAAAPRSDDAALSSGGHLGIPLVDASEVSVPQPDWMCELLNNAPDFVDAVGEQDAEALGEWIQTELAKKFPNMPRPNNAARTLDSRVDERKEMEF